MPSRGEIWLIDFEPVRGHEQGLRRPALVLSTDGFNHGPAGLVVVAPLTSRHRPGLLWRVEVQPPEGGLRQPSYVMCDMIRTVSTERCAGNAPWGRLSAPTMAVVNERLRFLLDL